MKQIIILLLFICSFSTCRFSNNGNPGPTHSGQTIGVVNGGVPISLEAIDASYYQRARDELDLIYSGTSHSSQINTGIADLATREAWCDWTFRIGTYGLDGDLGAPDLFSWAATTRTYLDDNPTVNVCMWSWCGEVGDADVEADGHYLDLMEQLITDYPAVTFVFMTGHCDGNGPDGAVNRENDKIRAHCQANNRWLFDFADFDATAPDGTNYLDLNVNDRCEYDGGNWATEWIAGHPEDWHQCSCAHSTGEASLNCNRKAIGFVYLMARLAGWNGT
jgi:hypothetical protein